MARLDITGRGGATMLTAIPSDGELLAAIQRRDAGALACLYDRHRMFALSVACRILGDRAAAEDAVQDAFLAVWRRATSFDPARGTARCWLLAIVRHAAIDRRRGERTRPLDGVSLLDVTRCLATGADDVDRAAATAIETQHLRKALLTLPPAQREAIELAYFEGRTHEEIAANLDIPLGTVKGRLRLGLQKLRVCLADLVVSEAAGSAA